MRLILIPLSRTDYKIVAMASPICQNGLHVPSNNTNNGSWTSRMKTLSGFCSHKAIREGPKLLLKIAIGFGILTALTYLWSSSRKSGFYFITGATPISRAPTSGLRMVVFGGGDVATPSDDEAAWTEVMCQKVAASLPCDDDLFWYRILTD